MTAHRMFYIQQNELQKHYFTLSKLDKNRENDLN